MLDSSSPKYPSYDRGTQNAVSPYVTLSILIAGVAGGLIIVIAFILFCKYCVKKKHGLQRDQGTDCERSSDRRFKPFQRYETINSDMFSEPSTGSMDGIPISPRRLYEAKSHDKLPEADEVNESTKLKSDFEKPSYRETDLDVEQTAAEVLETEISEPAKDVPEVPVRRVSFQLDNLPHRTSGYLSKGRRYTEGDFHYLKKIRIDKRSHYVPRQYSLGSSALRDVNTKAIELFELEPIPAVAESYSDVSVELDDLGDFPHPHIMDSPSPKGDLMDTQVVNVEVHRGSNSVNSVNGVRPHTVTFAKYTRSPYKVNSVRSSLKPTSYSMDVVSPTEMSPRKNRRVKSYGDVADYDYDVLKITEFSTSPYFNNDLDSITETDSLCSSKVRYNDTGSLEVLNEEKLYMFDEFEFESIIPDESDADTETLNGAQKYREIWNLRTTLEEEEECSDTIRMEDMASPDDQSTDEFDRGNSYVRASESAQIVNNHNHTNGHTSSSPRHYTDPEQTASEGSNLLHPNYENRRENYQKVVKPRYIKKGTVSGENSFDSVETVDTDGDVSDTSRQEVTTTSFESNTDSTNDSQTSRLRQMKADSGYKSLETQPTHSNGTKKAHSMDDEIIVLESTSVAFSKGEEILEGVGTNEPVPRRSSIFEKRKGRTASKRRREYSRERQAVRLYESVCEPETDSARSDQPSGDSFDEPQTPNSKFSVFSRFFKSQRFSHNKSLSRDFSIDEKSNDIFQEFVRYDPKFEEHRGSVGGFIPNHRRHRFQRKYTDPGPGIYDETSRHWLSPEMRSTSLGSDSSASSARRISPQDSIEEEQFEDDIDAAVENHKNKMFNEESKPAEITTPSLSIHEIPIIKLPEGETVDA